MRCTVKKTVERLRQQDAHYLLCVKGNQPTLLAWLIATGEQQPPREVAQHSECSHGRQCHRRVSVYDQVGDWPQQWAGFQRWFKVERWGIRGRHPFASTHYYISDLALSAQACLEHGREHWSIENRLHWPKDVVLQEDSAPQQSGSNAPANFSILRNFFITASRRIGFDSIAQAKRHLANQLKQVLLSLQ